MRAAAAVAALLALAATAPGAEAAGPWLEEAEDLLRQAATASPPHAQDLARRAALRYDRALQHNGPSGKLLYNLGTAYLAAGDLGRAVLSFRRAEQLTPDDKNLARNLALARRLREDALAAPDRRTRFIDADLLTSPPFLLALFAGGWSVFWLGAALFRLGRAPRWLPIFGCVLAAVAAGLLSQERLRSEDVAGVVLVPETEVRQGPTWSDPPAFAAPLHAGAEFERLETQGDWLYVQLPDGRRGWLPAADAELVAAPPS